MKRYTNVQSLRHEIDAYVEHFNGAPLLVGIDNSQDYS